METGDVGVQAFKSCSKALGLHPDGIDYVIRGQIGSKSGDVAGEFILLLADGSALILDGSDHIRGGEILAQLRHCAIQGFFDDGLMAGDLTFALGFDGCQHGVDGDFAIAAFDGDIPQNAVQGLALGYGQLVALFFQGAQNRGQGDGRELLGHGAHVGFDGVYGGIIANGLSESGDIPAYGVMLFVQLRSLIVDGLDDGFGAQGGTESGYVAGQFFLLLVYLFSLGTQRRHDPVDSEICA